MSREPARPSPAVPAPAVPEIFDRRAVRLHRARAAAGEGAGFLAAEVAGRLAERLDEVRRRFPLALDLGCGDGATARALAGRGGIERLVSADAAFAYACRAASPALVAEAEALPFAPASFDLVVSSLALHWTNDLPGALAQFRRLLRPDGLLLVSLWGGGTLDALREALIEGELAEEGGASPRVSPFADPRDLGGLLQRAGFALPVVDTDEITVTYPDAFALMHDLRAMGEGNAVAERRRGFTRRATLARAAAHYQAQFAGPDGRIAARFALVTLTAWAPAPGQPQPLRPGSAKHRLADALGGKDACAPPDGSPSSS